MAIAVASERMCERAKSIAERGAFLDLVAFQEAAEAFQPTFTPAIPLLFGLEQQLVRIEESGGIEARWSRHEAMRGVVENWTEQQEGFGFLPEIGRRSWAVSCLNVPPGENARSMAKTLETDGFHVGSGSWPKLSKRMGFTWGPATAS
jgi:aspartate aminotransferase-like enzyme